MLKVYTGRVRPIQESEIDEEELQLFFTDEDNMNKECCLVVYQDTQIQGVLTYEDMINHRTFLRKTFVHSQNVFLEVCKFILEKNKEDAKIEYGQSFAVLDDKRQLLYILEYVDENAGISGWWNHIPHYLTYTYEIEKADCTILKRADMFVFEECDEYAYGLAQIIRQYDNQAKIFFGDKRARFFFDEKDEQIRILSWQSMREYIYEQCLDKRIMYITKGRLKTPEYLSLFQNSYGCSLLFHKVFWPSWEPDKQIKNLKYLFINPMKHPGGFPHILPIIEAAQQFADSRGLKLVFGEWDIPLMPKNFFDKYINMEIEIDDSLSESEEAIQWNPWERDFHFPTREVYNCEYEKWRQWFKEDFLEMIEKRSRKYLVQDKRILGIVARGSDYKKTLAHPKQAPLDVVINRARKMMKYNGYEYIFLATEDAEIYETFREAFGKELLFIDQKRVRLEDFPDDSIGLADVDGMQDEAIREKLMIDYFTAIYCISKCNALLASGNCGSVRMAIGMNDGAYEEKYIYDLGVN